MKCHVHINPIAKFLKCVNSLSAHSIQVSQEADHCPSERHIASSTPTSMYMYRSPHKQAIKSPSVSRYLMIAIGNTANFLIIMWHFATSDWLCIAEVNDVSLIANFFSIYYSIHWAKKSLLLAKLNTCKVCVSEVISKISLRPHYGPGNISWWTWQKRNHISYTSLYSYIGRRRNNL